MLVPASCSPSASLDAERLSARRCSSSRSTAPQHSRHALPPVRPGPPTRLAIDHDVHAVAVVGSVVGGRTWGARKPPPPHGLVRRPHDRRRPLHRGEQPPARPVNGPHWTHASGIAARRQSRGRGGQAGRAGSLPNGTPKRSLPTADTGTTRVPRGTSASGTIFQQATPNGIPMIVTHNSSPAVRWISASSHPNRMIHRTLPTSDQMPASRLTTTVRPKGQDDVTGQPE